MIVNLDWDSAFFGLKAGRAELAHGELPEPAELNEYDLVYLFAAPEDTEANAWAVAQHAILADEKVTYKKQVEAVGTRVDGHIISYTRRADQTDELVVGIGMQSGIYSRFAVDKNFAPNDFERLYRIWMDNSIDRVIAAEVLIYEEQGKPQGVLTLGVKNGCADIGILAVDHEARGRQAGRKLVEAAELWSSENGHSCIQVVTQKANQPACRFYQACGFNEDSVNNIYHWWKK